MCCHDNSLIWFSSSKECQNHCRTLILIFSWRTPPLGKNIGWLSTKFVLSHLHFFRLDGVICLARRIIYRNFSMKHNQIEIMTTFLGFDRSEIFFIAYYFIWIPKDVLKHILLSTSMVMIINVLYIHIEP
jgi:hypothetical protein